jgi:hypothetical protein
MTYQHQHLKENYTHRIQVLISTYMDDYESQRNADAFIVDIFQAWKCENHF